MKEQVNTKKIAFSEIIIAFLMLVVISIFQVIYIYTANIQFLTVGNVMPFALLFAGIAISVSVILFLILKSPSKAAFWGGVFIMLFINYRHLEGLAQLVLPQLRYWHFMPISICIYLLLMFFGIRAISAEIYKKICVFLLIPFSLLILLNIFMAMPAMIENAQSENIPRRARDLTQTVDQHDQPLDLPNIYFFIFDEYGGFEVLENLYNYGNSTFERFLNDNNFEVSRSSRNSSTQTHRILLNLLNLEYIDYEYANAELRPRLLESHALFTLLESYEYTIRGVGATDFMSVPSESRGVPFVAEVRTIDGHNIETIILRNTIIYPFFHRAYAGAYGQTVLSAFEFMNSIDNIPVEPTFTLFYILSPHQPFIFDRNGNIVNARNRANWDDPRYYLEQLQFITNLTTQTIEFLLAHDPDSIIILQSDHGPRSFGGTFYDLTNILNTVYFRGEPISEINGLSGVNTLRVILSRLLNIEMPVLEVPQP